MLRLLILDSRVVLGTHASRRFRAGPKSAVSNRRTAIGATGAEASILSTYLEFRNIEAFPAEEQDIDGPGAMPDHRQSGAKLEAKANPPTGLVAPPLTLIGEWFT